MFSAFFCGMKAIKIDKRRLLIGKRKWKIKMRVEHVKFIRRNERVNGKMRRREKREDGR